VIQTNSVTFAISRTMALDFGLVEPTPEEAAQRAAEVERHRAESAARWPAWETALAALAALDNPIVRAVLDHHRPSDDKWLPTCDGGCDYAGFEGEPPEWPCSTVELIAETAGIDMPPAYTYGSARRYGQPAEESSARP
jgi:hypothetical protein